MDKLYYSIGEAAGILGENVSLVRFWTDSFPEFLHPRRNAKGNRMYRAEDVEATYGINLPFGRLSRGYGKVGYALLTRAPVAGDHRRNTYRITNQLYDI